MNEVSIKYAYAKVLSAAGPAMELSGALAWLLVIVLCLSLLSGWLAGWLFGLTDLLSHRLHMQLEIGF